MGAKKKSNRHERKKAKKKLLQGLMKDPRGSRKTYKKHG
jgi:hypothetical protein